MSWVTIIMNPDDSKVKVDKFYLKKIVIDTVREDQFMYILLEVDYKVVLMATVFLSSIFRSFSLRTSLLIYTTSPL